MAENTQPVFSIEKLYVKDLSLEVPGAPQIFLEREAPQINVQLRTAGQAVEDGVYEVTLTVTVNAKIGEDRNLFLVEVAQPASSRSATSPRATSSR
jgi:protein translocase subunit secB